MKTPSKSRAATFDAAIITLQAEAAKLRQLQRDKIRNLTIEPAELEQIDTRIQELARRIESHRTLRAAAAKQDDRDLFLSERANMRKLQDEMMQLLGSRESDAEELDQLFSRVGEVLQRIAAKNAEAWSMFRTVSRYITLGDARRARYDSLIYSNQSRVSTAAAVSEAFVVALKLAGVGRVGILENLAFESVVSYRVDRVRTMQEAMREANSQVERHLAVAHKQKVEEFIGDEDEEEPANVVEFSRPPA